MAAAAAAGAGAAAKAATKPPTPKGKGKAGGAAAAKAEVAAVSYPPLPPLDWETERKRMWPLLRGIEDMREALRPTPKPKPKPTAAAADANAAAGQVETAAASAAAGAAVDPDVGLDAFSESAPCAADYIVFGYDMGQGADTFPDPTAPGVDARTAVLWQRRREARGLICCAATGAVLARRFHKFFNCNELDETDVDTLQRALTPAGAGGAALPYILLDKMDGAFVSPFRTGGQFRFGTKPGAHNAQANEVHAFAAAAEAQHAKQQQAAAADGQSSDGGGVPYLTFCSGWYARDYSCIFEWCSPTKQLVVAYASPQLVLTAIRHHTTGAYVPYDAMCAAARAAGVPVVSARALPDSLLAPPSNAAAGGATSVTVASMAPLRAVVEWVHGLDGVEGVVLRVAGDGRMYKLKTRWYLQAGKGNRQQRVSSLFRR